MYLMQRVWPFFGVHHVINNKFTFNMYVYYYLKLLNHLQTLIDEKYIFCHQNVHT